MSFDPICMLTEWADRTTEVFSSEPVPQVLWGVSENLYAQEKMVFLLAIHSDTDDFQCTATETGILLCLISNAKKKMVITLLEPVFCLKKHSPLVGSQEVVGGHSVSKYLVHYHGPQT